ncbi:DUF881 domain-containing protein [Youngiibacter fragilis]|uniref:Division initiation protein n=1 Tax=Youngiibacter fragilis 232.1 TaxID=994573 RepID=V7I9P7_9CLOT|nr:DUF881 domain-containing protein [Youngiibacter fragilis]ETA82064.1 hypothetical protein T472_0203625 [Youngiibacter fragilis 232.1]
MKARHKVMIFMIMVILGVITVLLFKVSQGSMDSILTTAEFKDKNDHRLKLLSDVKRLEEENVQIREKLDTYREALRNEEISIAEIERELIRNKALAGSMKVTGSGIVITMQDGEMTSGDEKNEVINYLRTIHNTDMLKIINELRNSGAEAIAINGERILETSEVYCSWAFITINGEKLPAPFVIEVIGDTDKLRSYLASDYGFVRMIGYRGVKVEVTESESITIEGTDGFKVPLHMKFAEPKG